MQNPRTLMIALMGIVTSAASAAFAVPPTEEMLQKIRDAAPGEAPAKPAKARKLLVFNKPAGFRHSSIETGTEAMRLLGEKSKAFTADATGDPAAFNAENLKQYDAVCLLNTTGNFLDTDEQKKALMEFVKSGKGVVGIHAATDAFYDWPEYGQMIGGYFDGHPWHEKVTLRIDDPDHLCNKCFAGKPFEVVDEIYQFRPEPYSRKALRVLTSLDTSRTDMNKPGVKRGKDGDYGVSWVREFGEGRVFYCSLGHREEIYWNPTVMAHYLAGIQFAMGDLEADATPSEAERSASNTADADGRCADAAPADSSLIDQLKAYKTGADGGLTARLAESIKAASADPAARERLEGDLLTVLEDADATPEGKQLAAKQLWVIGSERSVPALAKLLGDEKLSHAARYALERMPGEAAGAALLAALDSTQGNAKVGVINSIGARRDDKAVGKLAELAGAADPAVRQAAIGALGKIGGDAAAQAISRARAQAGEDAKPLLADAYLTVADRFLEDGKKDRAAAIYRELFAAAEPEHVRVAALRGLVASEENGIKVLVDQLAADDPRMKVAAVRMLQQERDPRATQEIVKAMDGASPSVQAVLADALASRGDKSAAPAIAKLAETSGEQAAQVAALAALAKLGDASSVPLLAGLAAKSKGDVRNAARTSLASLRGRDVNERVLAELKGADPDTAVELVRALGERQADETVEQLLQIAGSAKHDVKVRREAYRVVGELADGRHLPAVLAFLVKETDTASLANAERAAQSIASRIEDPAARAQPILAVHAGSSGASRAALVRVLGVVGGPDALGAIRADAKSSDPAVREAAVRALAAWPDPAVADDLLALAKGAEDRSAKLLALRGYIRLAGVAGQADPNAAVEMYKQAMAVAERPDEKRLVLGGLSNIASPEALELTKSFAADPQLKAEAEQAVQKIQQSLNEAATK